MLELIRKQQKWIMILVAVIVIFAFAWWGDFFGQGDANRGSTQPVIGFGGKTYTQSQLENLAKGSQFSQNFFPKHNYLMASFAKYPGGAADYAINTVALRKHAGDYGIVVSPKEIDQRMLGMAPFRTPEARSETFQRFGYLGMGEAQMVEVVGDVIRLEKLEALLSAGLIGSEIGAEYGYARRHQTVFAEVATFPEVTPDSIEVTEEELKEAYEARKEELVTERKVAIRYVYFKSPEQDAKEKEAKEAKEKADAALKEKDQKEAADKVAREKEEKEKEEAFKEEAKKEEAAKEEAKKEAEAKAKAEEQESGSGNVSPEASSDGIENEGDGTGKLPGIECDEETGGETGAAEDESVKVEPQTGETSLVEPETEGAEGVKPLAGDTDPENSVENELSDGPSAEEMRQLVKDYKLRVDDFWNEFFNDGKYDASVDFGKVAADPKYGVEVVDTEVFSMSDPPEEIADQWSLLSAAIGQSEALPISDPIPASGERIGYFIFKLVEVEEPVAKTFEEAKEELEKLLQVQKAEESTFARIDEARAKLLKSMEGGTMTFVEAAKEAGFEVEEFAPISPYEVAEKAGLFGQYSQYAPPPLEMPNLREFYNDLMELAPGAVSEPIALTDKMALLHVSKRELWKRIDSEQLKDEARRQAVSLQSRTLLQDWFLKVRDAWDEKPL